MLRCLVLSLGLCLSPALGATWTYDVLQNGRDVGGMVIEIERDGATTTARYRLGFQVAVMRIPILAYERASTEVWEGDRLVALDGESRVSDRRRSVSVRREEEGLRVQGRGEDWLAPLDAVPASLWNVALVEGRPVFDVETGRERDIRATEIGTAALTVAGETMPARRWRIDGLRFPLEVWYGPDDELLAVRTRAFGQLFEFVRRS